MTKFKIPEKNKDLRKYALWKNLKYLLGYLAYITVMAAAFIFFLNGRHEDAEPLHWIVYVIYPAVILVSGWFIFFMTRFVSDKSLSGEIVEMAFLRDFGRGINREAKFSLDDHTYVKMWVKDGKGKRRRVKATLFDDGYDGYYKEGRTLIKFRGLNYPICPESEAEGAHLCAVCGVRTYYKKGKMKDGEAMPKLIDGVMICRSCGHTLMDIESWETKK